MSAYPKLIATLIGESGVGCNNAKTHEEIKSKISYNGFNDSKLDELLELNATVEKKYQEFEVRHGEQIKATFDLDEKLAGEITEYCNFRRLAYHVLHTDEYKGFRSQLGIDLALKRSLASFIEQAKQFYETILKKNEIMNVLSVFSFTAEKMQERLTGLTELRHLNEIQESKKGIANIARKERDDTYFHLKGEWARFKTACLIAFRKNQEYLKIVNVRPPAVRIRKSTTPETPPVEQPVATLPSGLPVPSMLPVSPVVPVTPVTLKTSEKQEPQEIA